MCTCQQSFRAVLLVIFVVLVYWCGRPSSLNAANIARVGHLQRVGEHPRDRNAEYRLKYGVLNESLSSLIATNAMLEERMQRVSLRAARGGGGHGARCTRPDHRKHFLGLLTRRAHDLGESAVPFAGETISVHSRLGGVLVELLPLGLRRKECAVLGSTIAPEPAVRQYPAAPLVLALGADAASAERRRTDDNRDEVADKHREHAEGERARQLAPHVAADL